MGRRRRLRRRRASLPRASLCRWSLSSCLAPRRPEAGDRLLSWLARPSQAACQGRPGCRAACPREISRRASPSGAERDSVGDEDSLGLRRHLVERVGGEMSAGVDTSARRIDEDVALRAIVEGTASETGREFYRALVRNLAGALDTYGAWLTEVDPGDPNRLRALAFWMGDRFIDPY